MKRITVEEFTRRANEVHSGKYDYSGIETISGQDSLLNIRCPEHGVFVKSARLHLRGVGCPQCSSKTRSQKISEVRQRQETIERRKYWNDREFTAFINKAQKIHENKYDYSQVDYRGCQVPVKIVCPTHGIFMQKPVLHLQGKGCRLCKVADRRMGVKKFIERSREIHGDRYDYSLISEYKNNQSRLTIVCPEHGEFEQAVHAHLKGIGCPFCGNIKKGLSQRFTTEDFILKAAKLHNGKYDYSRVNYITAMTPVEIICPDHGSFMQMPYQHLIGEGCPRCVHMVSNGENEIGDWLVAEGFRVERNIRGIVSNRSELDIYLPDQKVAIEYNGIYWHSSRTHRRQTRHLNKLQLCEAKGIRLIQLWDIEWEQKKDICKEIILFALGRISRRIYARDCTLKEINSKTANRFRWCYRKYAGPDRQWEQDMILWRYAKQHNTLMSPLP